MDVSWKIRGRLRIFAVALLLGIGAGIFVLFPINEFVYYSEYQATGRPAVRFAVSQLQQALLGQKPRKIVCYLAVGIVLSLGGAAIYASMARRSERIRQLSAALEGDVRGTIARGESASLEFQSTFRWDLREGRINCSLETVVMKTLAGYMNSRGGTLLIGVSDDGGIVGLENDYSALKKPGRDGFEGKDVCRVIVSPAHRPEYVRDSETSKLYVRTGVSTRELNVQEAINYTATRWKT